MIGDADVNRFYAMRVIDGAKVNGVRKGREHCLAEYHALEKEAHHYWQSYTVHCRQDQGFTSCWMSP
jgi:hypothetical protein